MKDKKMIIKVIAVIAVIALVVVAIIYNSKSGSTGNQGLENPSTDSNNDNIIIGDEENPVSDDNDSVETVNPDDIEPTELIDESGVIENNEEVEHYPSSGEESENTGESEEPTEHIKPTEAPGIEPSIQELTNFKIYGSDGVEYSVPYKFSENGKKVVNPAGDDCTEIATNSGVLSGDYMIFSFGFLTKENRLYIGISPQEFEYGATDRTIYCDENIVINLMSIVRGSEIPVDVPVNAENAGILVMCAESKKFDQFDIAVKYVTTNSYTAQAATEAKGIMSGTSFISYWCASTTSESVVSLTSLRIVLNITCYNSKTGESIEYEVKSTEIIDVVSKILK